MKYSKITNSEGNESFVISTESEVEAQKVCEILESIENLETETAGLSTAMLDMANAYDEVVEPLTALAGMLKTE